MSTFVFLDSFDRWSNDDDCGGKWNQVYGTTQTTVKRTGERALRLTTNAFIKKNYSGKSLDVGFAIHPIQTPIGTCSPLIVYWRAELHKLDAHGNLKDTSSAYGSSIFRFYYGEEKLRAVTGPCLSFTNAPSTDELFDNSQYIYLDEWSHMEFTITVSQDDYHIYSLCGAKLNEIDQGSQTLEWEMNVLTANEGWEVVDINIISFSIQAGTGLVYIDDFYATNDGLISGDLEVMVLEPEEDVLAEWTPIGSTDHFDCVNDTLPDDDSTYVYSNTLDNRELYVMEDTFLPSGTDIQGAQGVMYCRKNLPGTGQMQMDWRFLGHSDVNVNVGSPGTSYTCHLKAYSRHPITDTVMSSDEIDDLQMGFTKK